MLLQRTNNQSNRKHRNEDYLLERLNEHSGVEEEACRGDRMKARSAILLHNVLPLHSEIDTIKSGVSIPVKKSRTKSIVIMHFICSHLTILSSRHMITF